MSQFFLSRARLRREPAIDALAAQLLPDDAGARVYAAHRLIWSLFAGDAAKQRDFLFRELAAGQGQNLSRTSFLVLSPQKPNAEHPLLEVETKPFAPDLAAGQILGFSLRANPVIQTGAKNHGGTRSKALRRDVVMEALYHLPGEVRAASRPALIQSAGRQWLEHQASRSGFELLPPDDEEDEDPNLRIDGYEQLRFGRIGKSGRISVLEYDGHLKVTDPSLFLSRLQSGFGRARAFGCGLMLIRRVSL